MSNKEVFLTTPDQLGFFHLLQLKGALKLEMLGIRQRQGSVYAYVKKHLGFKGNKQKVLNQLEQYIEDVRTGEKFYRGYGGVERS